ncbi:hypothetical protein P3T76_003098 [Phytophthora citrophthora]|uniref:PDZ domain-containing protein n=1 Tax=Phytophthora citrophthora TaxID=4793 RepID=A0AAD9GWX4_9STRA|nr:hypothetical protein P3T76_003098 [Phytophthora citrophthora]
MPLDRFRSAIFSRHKAADQHAHSGGSTTVHFGAGGSSSWSSVHDDFTSLRFLVWTGGDPGFTLTTARGSDESAAAFESDEDAELIVDRVTASKVWEAGIRPGDVLETVSDKRVYTMDTEAAIVLVQMSKSPSIVRFRSPTKINRVRFDVLLGRQKIGLFFTGDGIHDIPVVTRIGNQSFHTASASSSGIRLGDILVAVNGTDTVAAGLKITTKYLETCPRPARLTFERASNDDNTDGRFGGQLTSEESVKHGRRSRSLIAMSQMTREAASLRCRQVLKSLIPAPKQLETGEYSDSHETHSSVIIEWKSGSLGLTLMEDAISGVPVVNRLTGKGSSANLERLQHGFELYSINGVQTEDRSLDDLYRDLVRLAKPVRLIFRPPESDDTGDNDRDSGTSSPLEVSSNVQAGLNNDNHHSLDMKSSAQQTSCASEQFEYEVSWSSRQLGLKLKILHASTQEAVKTPRHQYPTIHEVLKESTLGLSCDAVGHQFISVNNWSTSGLSASELRTLLKVATRPALLRFRRQEILPNFQKGEASNRNSTLSPAYSILWSEGKLGIIFGCYVDADRQNALTVYVKHVGPGQAQQSKLVAAGDILRSINGQDLPPKQKFKKTMRKLIKSRQPVTLGFRRLLVERNS